VSLTELTASMCSSCGHTTVYTHSRCPNCRGVGFVEVRFKEGRVLTYTILSATRPGFGRPLILAMVEFENAVRAVGQLDGAEPRTGSRVRVSHGQLSEKEGVISTGLKFVPAD